MYVLHAVLSSKFCPRLPFFYSSCGIPIIPRLSSVPPTFPGGGTEEELELPDGSPLLLNCTAWGNPSPAYSWRFPDPTQLTFMNETTNGPVLEPVLQLPGVYTCTVRNSQGSATKTFTVVEPESKTFPPNPASSFVSIWFFFCLCRSIIPPCCCFQQVAAVGPPLPFYRPCFSS